LVQVDRPIAGAILDFFDQGVLPADPRVAKLRPGPAGVTTKVGIARRAECKVIDKIVRGLKFNS
jgi:hypothetical protein